MHENTPTQKRFAVLENVMFLKKTPVFSSIETSELRAIAAIVDELGFSPGTLIVKENDVGDSLYVIKSGSVRITKNIDGKQVIELAELGQGQCFGDMAVIDAELRSASVWAKEECTLLQIKRDDLMDVIVDHPFISIELLKIFVKRLREANGRIEKLSRTKE